MWAKFKRKLRGAHRSLTVQFNAVLGTLIIALPELNNALPGLREFITPEVYRWLIMGTVVVNLWLRARTSKPLEER